MLMHIQVHWLFPKVKKKKLISPLFVVSTSAIKHEISYDTELSGTSY